VGPTKAQVPDRAHGGLPTRSAGVWVRNHAPVLASHPTHNPQSTLCGAFVLLRELGSWVITSPLFVGRPCVWKLW
jgi:hypothetical protein